MGSGQIKCHLREVGSGTYKRLCDRGRGGRVYFCILYNSVYFPTSVSQFRLASPEDCRVLGSVRCWLSPLCTSLVSVPSWAFLSRPSPALCSDVTYLLWCPGIHVGSFFSALSWLVGPNIPRAHNTPYHYLPPPFCQILFSTEWPPSFPGIITFPWHSLTEGPW